MLDGPFRGSEAVRRGVVSRHRLRGPHFVRIFPDIYAPAGRSVDLLVRSLAAFQLVSSRDGVLAGYSAALLLGADVAPPGAPAEVLVDHRRRDYPGLTVGRGLVGDDEVTRVHGTRLTVPPRTAWDLCRRLPVDDAVVVLDALARVGRFAPTSLLTWRAANPGARGSRTLDEVVALADPRAESPGETRLRLALVRGGLPPAAVQYEIHDEHGFVLARADLAYPGHKVALEYDGAVHFTRRRRDLDLQRDVTLAEYGWQTLRFTRDDLGAAQTVWRVRSVLAARRTR